MAELLDRIGRPVGRIATVDHFGIQIGEISMDVKIDQPGHQCLAGDIDPPSTIRCDRAFGDFADRAVFDQHRHAFGAIRRHAVKYPCIFQNDLSHVSRCALGRSARSQERPSAILRRLRCHGIR